MAREIDLEFEGLLKDAISGLPETVQVKVWEELRIKDIDAEVDEAAARFGFWAVLAEKASYRLMRMEFAFDAWKDERTEQKQQELEARGERLFSSARMMRHLKTLASYRSYELQIIEFTYARDLLRSLARAFQMKKDLVQTKAANLRAE